MNLNIIFLLFLLGLVQAEQTEIFLNEEKTITVSSTSSTRSEEITFTPTLNEGKFVEFLVYGNYNINNYFIKCKNNKETPEEKIATRILSNTQMCFLDISSNKEGESITLTVSNFWTADPIQSDC